VPATTVLLVVSASSSFMPLADLGTALTLLATWISRKATALDEGIVLGKAEVWPSQGNQRYAGSQHLLQSRAPVLKSPEHTRPVVEPTVVHGLSLLSSL
jgi:hypothetical protein